MDLLHLVCKFVKVNLTVIVRMVLPEYIHGLTAGISRHSRPNFVLKFSPKISPVACERTLSNPLRVCHGTARTPRIFEIVLATYDDDDWLCHCRSRRQHSDKCGDPDRPVRHLTTVLQRARRRPTPGMLQGSAPPAECRMRCLPTSQGSSKEQDRRSRPQHR